MRPAFLFDRMLGRLCRKLRMLGYDCEINAEGESAFFLTNADSLGRIAVTTATRKLDRRGKEPVVLTGAGTCPRIAELFSKIGVKPAFLPLTRCIVCNSPLREASPEEVSGKVPLRIEKEFDRFHVCPGCLRIYWEGSHYEAMRREVEAIEAALKDYPLPEP